MATSLWTKLKHRRGRSNDPVVQIAYEDALAYAEWAGLSLPSETQWEYAARTGAEVISEPIAADGTLQANFYQGVFPARDLGEDGYTPPRPWPLRGGNGQHLLAHRTAS